MIYSLHHDNIVQFTHDYNNLDEKQKQKYQQFLF